MVIDHLCVYGTLKSNPALLLELGVESKLCKVGTCIVVGKVINLGEYPGLVAGDEKVFCDVLKILDSSALEKLDEYEEYNPADRSSSLFIRESVLPIGFDKKCWIYFYNK